MYLFLSLHYSKCSFHHHAVTENTLCNIDDDSPDSTCLGDKLQTIYDASVHIFYLSPTSSSRNRQEVINKYSVSLNLLWIYSFGKEHVKLKTTIPGILSRIMGGYDKYRKTNFYENPKRGIPSKNIRRINKE